MDPTPDALQAVYTAPPAAMATLLFLSGYIESVAYYGRPCRRRPSSSSSVLVVVVVVVMVVVVHQLFCIWIKAMS